MKRITLKHRLFNGSWTEAITRECFMQGPAAAVVLYDPKQDSVVLGEQFRVGALAEECPWLLEVVAGRFEAGESAEQTALRESQEEMNAHIKKLIPIFDFYSSQGATDEKVYLFCGIVDSHNMTNLCGVKEEVEDISVDVYPLNQAIQMMQDNKIQNAVGIISIQWLQLHRDTLQKKYSE